MTRLLRDYPRPEIRVEETDYGMRLTALRHLDDGRTHVRVTNQIFPAGDHHPDEPRDDHHPVACAGR